MHVSRLFHAVIAGLVLSLTMISNPVHAEESGDSPFKAKEKAPPPKPKTRTWTVKTTGDASFTFRFDFAPGIADVDKVLETVVTINQIPEKADIKFGRSVPQQNAVFSLELIDPRGKAVGRYKAHAIPFSRGKYGVHMTPKMDGVHTIRLAGKTDKGVKMSAEVKLPVNVWPLPKELEGSGDAPASARRRPIKL